MDHKCKSAEKEEDNDATPVICEVEGTRVVVDGARGVSYPGVKIKTETYKQETYRFTENNRKIETRQINVKK